MAFQVFDFHHDIRNVVITPEIRARFLRMEPGHVANRHTHDLGQEIFLVLQGQAEFEIEGHREVLGPGQLCFAARDEFHQVRCVGDEPMIMYLSVTPHIEPTHTQWDERGDKLPPRYGLATRNERQQHDPSAGRSTEELAAAHLAAAQELGRVAAENATAQQMGVERLGEALSAGDQTAAKAAVDDMWSQMYRTFNALRELSTVWNELTPRVGPAPQD